MKKNLTVIRVALAAFLLTGGITVFCVFFKLNPTNILFLNDIAISLAVADLSLQGEFPLAGPPSHLGGRSIGPVYYWYTTILWLLSGHSPYLVTLLSSAILSIALLWLLLLITSFFSKREHSLIGAAYASLLLSSGHALWVLRVPWHANFIPLLGALAITSALCVIRYGYKLLGLLLLALSLLAQSSLSALPMAATLAGVALLRGRSESAEQMPPLLSALATVRSQILLILLAIATLLCPISYELFYSPNISERILSGQKIEGAGIWNALTHLCHFFKILVDNSSDSFIPLLLIALTAILLSVGLFILRSRKFILGISALLLPLLAQSLALSLIKPPLYDHYLHALLIIPICLVAVAIAIGLEHAKTFSIILVATLLWCWQQAIPGSISALTNNPFPYENLQHVKELTQIMSEQTTGPESARIFIRGEGKLKENSIYLLLGKEYYPLMQSAAAFREMPTFRRHYSTKAGVVLNCPAPQTGEPLLEKRYSRNWKVGEPIELQSFPASAGCSLVRIKREITE